MTAFDSLLQRFRSMSRAMRWATLAAIGMVVFLLWDNVIRPTTDKWNAQTMRIEDRVTKVRSAEQVARQLRDQQTQGLIAAIGPVVEPRPVADGSKMFNDLVNELLQKHNATNVNFSSRARGRLPKNALIEITQSVRQIDRLTGDLKFDATPKAAAAIIAELESSPYIESINSLRMTRDAGGRVKVALSIEAWLLSTDVAKGEVS